MTEIIAYRNPVEAAFWQAITGAQFFPILVGIGVFFALLFGMNAIIVRVYGQMSTLSGRLTNAALAASAAAGIATAWWLWV